MPMHCDPSSLKLRDRSRAPRLIPAPGKAAVLKLAFNLVAASAALGAWAQEVRVEPINAITTWNMPWEAFFPNDFDLIHEKELHFEGIATMGGDPSIPLPATLWVQFDYLDPALGVIYSPAWGFPVDRTPTLTPIDVSWTIPFCPEQVSLHLATDAPQGGIVNIAGEFTHRCVPEPGTLALVGMSALVGSALRRRRPRLHFTRWGDSLVHAEVVFFNAGNGCLRPNAANLGCRVPAGPRTATARRLPA